MRDLKIKIKNGIIVGVWKLVARGNPHEQYIVNAIDSIEENLICILPDGEYDCGGKGDEITWVR